MQFDTAPAPHAAPATSVDRVMRRVVYALVPAAAVHVAAFGPGLIVHALVATLTALGCEYALVRARGRDARAALGDYSAVVMAVLLAFALPPLCPWYVTVVAAAFAIVFAKQLYGGLGFNLFNPAMAGYAAVLISFPEAMTRWPPVSWADGVAAAGWGEALAAIFTGAAASGGWDALTMATPLDQVRSELGAGRMMSEMSLHGRDAWLAFQFAVALGGVALLRLRVIRWHIPAATLTGVLLSAGLLSVLDSDAHASAWFHLTSGSAILCAFFIATDPVSAAASPRGRLLYGLGIGVLIVLIRVYGAYPDGVAFAVLLMNMAVPLIDYYTIPRAHGHARARDEDHL